MDGVIAAVQRAVWGPGMLMLVVGVGLLLTLRLRFLPFRRLGYALRLAFSPDRGQRTARGDVSRFQALMTSLAATLGTGNIAGVATALSFGGVGALFWMWMTALVGMATSYAEAILAVEYRVTNQRGEMSGGPMYYIKRGLGCGWLARLFAACGALACFGIGTMTQSNSVAASLESTFQIAPLTSGICMLVLTGLVIMGGIRNIARVSALLVPVMAVLYTMAGLVILIIHIERVPAAFGLIINSAFSGTEPMAAGFAGASVAQAIRYGVARGVFSNEAGMGSAPIAAAAARTDHPGRQALVSMTGAFLDTIIMCTLTGLVIIVTGTWESASDTMTGSVLTAVAFGAGLPGHWGQVIVTVGLVLFAYATVIGWVYYGEKCATYLLGDRVTLPYRLLVVCAVGVGAVGGLETVWNLSDIFNGMMALPNLIALFLLQKQIVALSRDFEHTIYRRELLSRRMSTTCKRENM